MIDSVVAFILDLVRAHGPLILFLAAFVETAAFVGLVIPGEALLAAGGYLVQRGQIAPEVAWVCVYLGALAGDHVAYALGRYGGRRLLRRLPLRGAIYRVERLVERYDGYVIFGGRFLGSIRAVLMLTVGAMGLPYRRFWLFELIGAAVWSAWWLGIGAAGGLLVERLGDFSVWRQALFVTSLSIAAILAWRYRSRLRSLLQDVPEGT